MPFRVFVNAILRKITTLECMYILSMYWCWENPRWEIVTLCIMQRKIYSCKYIYLLRLTYIIIINIIVFYLFIYLIWFSFFYYFFLLFIIYYLFIFFFYFFYFFSVFSFFYFFCFVFFFFENIKLISLCESKSNIIFSGILAIQHRVQFLFILVLLNYLR